MTTQTTTKITVALAKGNVKESILLHADGVVVGAHNAHTIKLSTGTNTLTITEADVLGAALTEDGYVKLSFAAPVGVLTLMNKSTNKSTRVVVEVPSASCSAELIDYAQQLVEFDMFTSKQNNRLRNFSKGCGMAWQNLQISGGALSVNIVGLVTGENGWDTILSDVSFEGSPSFDVVRQASTTPAPARNVRRLEIPSSIVATPAPAATKPAPVLATAGRVAEVAGTDANDLF